jgi:hypothetical protein
MRDRFSTSDSSGKASQATVLNHSERNPSSFKVFELDNKTKGERGAKASRDRTALDGRLKFHPKICKARTVLRSKVFRDSMSLRAMRRYPMELLVIGGFAVAIVVVPVIILIVRDIVRPRLSSKT